MDGFDELSRHWLLYDRNYYYGSGANPSPRGLSVHTTNYSTQSSVTNVQISNNIIYNTWDTAIRVQPNCSNIKIYNNVIDLVPTYTYLGTGIAIDSNGATGIEIMNNIIMHTARGTIYVNNASGLVSNNMTHGWGGWPGSDEYGIVKSEVVL